ncbi:benzoate transporter [Pantoea sp. DY-5]|nr:benzoate transporter [Pantoea sp. DY-5]
MIYDCFLYYDEDMLLDIRLNTLDDVVDYFVIVESTHTFTGKPKKLNFDIDKYERFKDKIVYVVFNELPILKDGKAGNYDAWANEAATRNAIMRGLKKAKDEDLILVSDVDEIFNPAIIKKINPKKLCTILHMPFYNYQFNLQVFNTDGSERQCRLPRATSMRNLKHSFDGKPESFRNIKKSELYNDFISRNWFKLRSKVVKNSGWHFSWIMTPERISEKMSSISHTEYDLPHLNNREHIIDALKNGKDLWNRERKLVMQELTNDKFPPYLVANKEKFKEFVL